MKKMKVPVLVCASVLSVALFASCKKSKESVAPPPPTVEGYWMGNYGLGNNNPDLFYAFLFRANGTVRIYSGNTDTSKAVKAEGSYTLQNNTVKTTYNTGADMSYSTTATLNAAFNAMEGSWKDNQLGLNKGGFSVAKK
ncbi:hypothetical protein LQ567_15600 [Niabella pedocola]|uniref:Lipocalin-like domain-containing protein n=1 Tax=Niabella pedocola TaxID=1752077 RepID=A0ABS8PT13_9BACT|nr:hypothetical protein [Niabella pedocola]MCD2424205.1 hypothetical protein [Niabella pedocola]